jgi:hypothetical protein
MSFLAELHGRLRFRTVERKYALGEPALNVEYFSRVVAEFGKNILLFVLVDLVVEGAELLQPVVPTELLLIG